MGRRSPLSMRRSAHEHACQRTGVTLAILQLAAAAQAALAFNQNTFGLNMFRQQQGQSSVVLFIGVQVGAAPGM